MLIITADDFGRTAAATDNTIGCCRKGRITSASTMVFMKDSRRAMELALSACLETGLHLNLDLPFDDLKGASRLKERHLRTMKHFRRGKWAQFFYNPLLRRDFDYVFKTQYEEYCRLRGQEPAHLNGHHHLHLSANMLVDRIIPPGLWVRRNFTFERGEKSLLNRSYRLLVDRWLVRHYGCTDSFFSIEPLRNAARLRRIMSRAYTTNVELMVHPAVVGQFRYLWDEEFKHLLTGIPQGNFRILSQKKLGGDR